MSDAPTDRWFYTISGQRLGPVAMGELRQLATSGQINPRTDLCWTHGMVEWLPAGEIDGLFEKNRLETRGEANPINDAHSLPRNPQAASRLSECELEIALLGANWPGASRRVFLAAIWVMPLMAAGVLAVFAHYFLDLQQPKDAEALTIVAGITGLMIFVLLIYISLQRFKNLGMSRLWILGNLVPFLNLWVGYRTICCPAGYEYHQKLDGIGIALAILYWGKIVLFLIFFALVVISMLGLGSGMIFDGLREFLDGWLNDAETSEAAAPPDDP